MPREFTDHVAERCVGERAEAQIRAREVHPRLAAGFGGGRGAGRESARGPGIPTRSERDPRIKEFR